MPIRALSVVGPRPDTMRFTCGNVQMLTYRNGIARRAVFPQVADELDKMVQRLERMHAVYDSCRAMPHHRHVYEALEATTDPLQPAPRKLMACDSDATARARAASVRRAAVWAPGVRRDEIKLSHTSITTVQARLPSACGW